MEQRKEGVRPGASFSSVRPSAALEPAADPARRAPPGRAEVGRAQCVPEEPNPRSPRSLDGSCATVSKRAVATSWSSSCAIRSPRRTV